MTTLKPHVALFPVSTKEDKTLIDYYYLSVIIELEEGLMLIGPATVKHRSPLPCGNDDAYTGYETLINLEFEGEPGTSVRMERYYFKLKYKDIERSPKDKDIRVRIQATHVHSDEKLGTITHSGTSSGHYGDPK